MSDEGDRSPAERGLAGIRHVPLPQKTSDECHGQLIRSCGDVGFVAAPVALGVLVDGAGAPAALGALALTTAASAAAFAVYGAPAPSAELGSEVG